MYTGMAYVFVKTRCRTNVCLYDLLRPGEGHVLVGRPKPPWWARMHSAFCGHSRSDPSAAELGLWPVKVHAADRVDVYCGQTDGRACACVAMRPQLLQVYSGDIRRAVVVPLDAWMAWRFALERFTLRQLERQQLPACVERGSKHSERKAAVPQRNSRPGKPHGVTKQSFPSFRECTWKKRVLGGKETEQRWGSSTGGRAGWVGPSANVA